LNQNKNLQSQVSSFVSSRIAQGKATDMSVYILDYAGGGWVGVNENKGYDAASLYKVPVMIAYYQQAEKDPALLTRKVEWNGTDQNEGEYFRSSHNIQPNTPYTIDQLIDSMIVNSDNTALILLTNSIDQQTLLNVYTDLGLQAPPNDVTLQDISAKTYASFFRVLYNGTYLTWADSQKALLLLSQSHLPNGIASAVPAGITVADKFGERTVQNPTGGVTGRELHDCGIVYKPGSPYLICVMSSGSDFTTLAQNIHDLSTLVYANIGSK
jgi:beta-lactamase class A